VADKPKKIQIIYDTNRLRTVPNFLTAARLCMVPFFLWAMLKGNYPVAFWLLLGAWLTDVLDGFIARRFRQMSRLGSVIDPAADYILGTAAFVALSLKGLIPPWFGAITITRDLALALGALTLILLDMKVIARPSILGKRSRAIQVVIVVLALLSTFEPFRFAIRDSGILLGLCYISAVIAIISCAQYMKLSFNDYDNRLLIKTSHAE
jgi:cardiolipin synthase